MEKIISEIEKAYGHQGYLIAFFSIMLICLFAWKRKRKVLIIPTLVLSIVILNPLFYDYWEKLHPTRYWRSLWMLPIIAIYSIIPSLIIEKVKKTWLIFLTIIVSVFVFIHTGSFVYSRASFSETDNSDKLPGTVEQIANALLEIDEYPYAIVEAPISTYIRQYSGKIKTLYARDVVFDGANSEEAKIVHDELSKEVSDFEMIAKIMLNHDYKYLVTREQSVERRAAITNSGFILLKHVGEYGIYEVSGKPTEKRVYNDKHQVTSITYIDENGKQILNEKGYASIHYIYDNKGQKTFVYCLDQYGNQVYDCLDDIHEYLLSLRNRNISIFISVRDEASRYLTEEVIEDMRELGLKTDLRGFYRYSYIGFISNDEQYENLSQEKIVYSGKIGQIDFTIESEGLKDEKRSSSIVINGVEYSKNLRGLNIVVFDNETERVIDSVAFDTHERGLNATR